MKALAHESIFNRLNVRELQIISLLSGWGEVHHRFTLVPGGPIRMIPLLGLNLQVNHDLLLLWAILRHHPSLLGLHRLSRPVRFDHPGR